MEGLGAGRQALKAAEPETTELSCCDPTAAKEERQFIA